LFSDVCPTAVFCCPLVVFASENEPIAVFCTPVVNASKALKPIAVVRLALVVVFNVL